MRKRIIYSLFIISAFFISSISSLNAAVINAESCSQAYVQAAIDSAKPGDTVIVPLGQCEWVDDVIIPDDKTITLQGAGMNETVINNGGTTTVSVAIGTSGSRVSGFTFNSVRITLFTGNARIDNNTFNRTSLDEPVSGISFHSRTRAQAHSPSALIDQNIFYNCRVVVFAGPVMQHKAWTLPVNMGNSGEHVVYIEDNVFYRTLRAPANIVDANYGGAYVFRYNTIYSIEGYVNIQTHSSQKTVNRATRYAHIYGNVSDATRGNHMGPTFLRAGTGVIFFNYFPGNWPTTNMSADNVRSGWSPEARFQRGTAISTSCNGSSPWDGNEPIDNPAVYGDNSKGRGTHNGKDGSPYLTDSTASWTGSSLVFQQGTRPGATVYNLTKGESCIITENEGYSVSCSLSGKALWDHGDEYKITDGYPCRDQIGRAYDSTEWAHNDGSYRQPLMPVYEWANMGDRSKQYKLTIRGASRVHIRPGRDYHEYRRGFDGTSGTGCGTIEKRPDRCTPGTAYWATKQSCLVPNLYAGAIATNPGRQTIEGTLYKCTMPDTWTVYFTPYEYPHPLRNQDN